MEIVKIGRWEATLKGDTVYVNCRGELCYVEQINVLVKRHKDWKGFTPNYTIASLAIEETIKKVK